MAGPPDASAALLSQISAQLSSLQSNNQTDPSMQPPVQNQATTSSVTTSIITVNALWFTSLIFSLTSASISILLKQWLRDYINDRRMLRGRHIETRHARYESLVRWRVKEIVMLLPLLLQIALILFLIGLVQLSWTLNSTVAVVVTIFISASLAFILITTLLPAMAPMCPYRSPQARLFFFLWHRMIPRFQAPLKAICRITAFVSQNAQGRLTNLIDKLTSFRDWLEWEQSYVREHFMLLDLMIVDQVYAASTTIYQEFLSISGPAMERTIALISSRVRTGPLRLPGQCYDLKWYLWHVLNYLDRCFSKDSSIPVHDAFLSSLTSLLRIPQFCGASWKIIEEHAHRFETPPSSKNLCDIIDFIEHSTYDNSTRSHHFSFITGSCVVVRLATLMPDADFTGARDELKEFFQTLKGHIRNLFTGCLSRSDAELFQNLETALSRAGFGDIQDQLKELCQILSPHIYERITAQQISLVTSSEDAQGLEKLFQLIDPYIRDPDVLLRIAGFDGDPSRYNLHDFFRNLTCLRDLFKTALDDSNSSWHLFCELAHNLFTVWIDGAALSLFDLCKIISPHVRELFTAGELSRIAGLDGARPELKQLFEILSIHISDIFAADHLSPTNAMNVLQDCIHRVLELAQDHIGVIPDDFVSICEEVLNRLNLLPDTAFDANPIAIKSTKQDMMRALQAIRELMEKQGTADPSFQQEGPLPQQEISLSQQEAAGPLSQQETAVHSSLSSE